jgi:hypothetical protein
MLAVLQADSTTQSALSLSCATSLAVNSPSSRSLGSGQCQRKRRLAKSLNVARDQAVGCEVHDAVIGEPRALHLGLGGAIAEMNVSERRAELSCDGLQLLCRVGQGCQCFRELCPINSAAAPVFGVGAGLAAILAFVALGDQLVSTGELVAQAIGRPGKRTALPILV